MGNLKIIHSHHGGNDYSVRAVQDDNVILTADVRKFKRPGDKKSRVKSARGFALQWQGESVEFSTMLALKKYFEKLALDEMRDDEA